MQIQRMDTRRHTETPNAAMTTLASPTLGGSAAAVWLVRMEAHAQGPEHAFDSEQVWALTAGSAVVRVDDSDHALSAGDTVVLLAGEMRRITAGQDGFDAVVTGRGGSQVSRADGGETVIPPWVS